MILPVEKWLETQRLSLEAASCFHEAFSCYRASAYKAALLFSYVGFMNVIRDRIIASACPSGIPTGQWTHIHQSLIRAGTWDSAAFDACQQKSPAPVFVIPDDLRRQVEFWKDRRNDCAHSKDNKISASHVEAFFAFVESNINKFAVNGSRAEMTRRIQEHYDPSITPPGSDASPLVRDIAHAVLNEEINDFLSDISASFDAARNPVQKMLKVVSPHKLEFFNVILQAGAPPLERACINFLLADETFLLSFLRVHPERISLLNGHPDRVRRLWHEFLFVDTANDFPILSGMLRNNLIPAEQIDECITLLIKRGTAAIPNDIDNAILEEKGFYRILESILTETTILCQFEWANKCKSLVVKHVADHPLSLEMAKAIYRFFDSGYHPWHLTAHLNELFKTNESKRDEYHAISTANPEIGIPGLLPGLQKTP